ncbi:hypothetical protein MRB53_036025 [Persea americana]|uniref:Uncharacterized protein n=1 Tax=Persea americana TaxID=3435 RepID=A0ACC2K6I2_PERAE|nr:hypothetical protein MRB53_036025 [Persea americana]
MPQQVSHHRNADVVGACSLMMRVGPVSLGGAPKTCSPIVGMKNPFTGRKGIKKRMPEWRSLTLEGLRRGYLPMNVLLEAKKARLQPRSLDNALSELVGLLNDMKHHLHRIEFSKLEEVARKLEMSRKEDLAVETLKKVLKPSESGGLGALETYEVQLILVEMLIYQGSYKEASELCENLEKEHQGDSNSTPRPDSIYTESIFSPFSPGSDIPVERVGPSNTRLKLYQAVASAMLNKPEALKHWDEFERMSSSYGKIEPPKKGTEEEPDEVDEEDDRPPVAEHEMTVGDYEQFLEHIEVLKKEIQAARKASSA